MGTPADAKHPSPIKSPTTPKSPRPGILKRRSTPGKSAILGSARFERQEVTQESKPDMAASFLQFCAMCEKQIMTPSNSILYCSEACRRKDSMKPLSAAIISTTSISPPSSEPPSPRPVLSPRVPTGVILSSTSVNSIPADLHDHTSDLDPSEWKPKLPERGESEAFRYLSRFHRSARSSTDWKNEQNPSHLAGSVPTPSLGTTPNTTASSSLSTSAALAFPYGTSHNGYDFNTRPLPLRQNRWYSFNSGTPKGVDLVTPHIAPPANESSERLSSTLTTPEDNGMKWEKRKVMFSTPGIGDDGLSILFAERK